MFDKVYKTEASEHYSTSTNTTTIKEHKAPTDDSIRLYGEMLNKSRKEVVDTIELQSNSLYMTAILFKDLLSSKLVCVYRIVLNDRPIEGTVKVTDYTLDKRKILIQILEKLSEQIALELMEIIINAEESKELFK